MRSLVGMVSLVMSLSMMACGSPLQKQVTPVPTTLRLSNHGAAVVYYQEDFWFQLKDGTSPLTIDGSCLQSCEADRCVGCAADARAPIAKALAMGASVDKVWDGRYWAAAGQNTCGTCFLLDKIDDRDLSFFATYGTSVDYWDNTGGSDVGQVKDLHTLDKAFRLGNDGVVELVIP